MYKSREYHSRYIEEEVRYAAKNSKVVLIVGARQVGKSTLLENLFPDYPVITFNPLEDVKSARKDPAFFLSQFDGPVILDEIQFAPELLAYIKIKVDQSGAMGQYFLTGSQNLSVLKSVAESMAGRVVIIELTPMIIYEVAQNFSMTNSGASPKHWLEHYLTNPQSVILQAGGTVSGMVLTEAVWRGGYPGVLGKDERWFSRYFSGYLKTYIERDVRTQTDVEQLMKFEHFVALLAALTAKEINYTELGRDIAAHGSTARRWLEIVRATYLWRDVSPFVGNTIKRVTTKTKGYFIDTGFACQLLRITSPEHLLGHPMFGFLFETYISNMLFSVLQAVPFSVGQYHWRTNGGAEVDLVLEHGNALYPIEIKVSSVLGKHDARGLRAFRETYASGPQKVMPGIIVYSGADCYWVEPDVLAVPWNLLMRS
ncbi:MAG: uncharacterized protein QG632_453 [Candidatus Dependentiae bacterium]|nr:uncharacterized protein [Candidatus Dependentiae bacterium]